MAVHQGVNLQPTKPHALTDFNGHVKLKCLSICISHAVEWECSRLEVRMRSGVDLIRAFVTGAGLAIALMLLLAVYFRVSENLRLWIANLKMKSLFRRSERKRRTARRK
jgi:hypothetical protein